MHHLVKRGIIKDVSLLFYNLQKVKNEVVPTGTTGVNGLMEVESFLIFSRCPDMTVIEDNSDQYHLE